MALAGFASFAYLVMIYTYVGFHILKSLFENTTLKTNWDVAGCSIESDVLRITL